MLLETNLKTLLPVAIADKLVGHFASVKHAFSVEHNDSKLQSWLKKVKVLSPGQHLLAPTIDPSIQRTVYNVLMQGFQLEMDYLPVGNTEAKYYGLVQYGSVIYLVVTINEHIHLRLLVLHRIQNVTLKEQFLRSIAFLISKLTLIKVALVALHRLLNLLRSLKMAQNII